MVEIPYKTIKINDRHFLKGHKTLNESSYFSLYPYFCLSIKEPSYRQREEDVPQQSFFC